MRETVESKTPWIGEFPAVWEQTPLHALFEELKNKNKNGCEQNLLSLSYGNIIRKDINSNVGLLPENFNGYNIINSGDIVLRLTDLQNDHRSLRTGLATEKGIITSAYLTLRKKLPLCSEYYHYLLHAFDTMKVFYSMGEGIRQSIGYDELAYISLPQPPLSEQRAIADFLDKQCAAIDEAIERHKGIIEKLEEYRKNRITNVVMHGITATDSVKTNSNEWVNEVPNNWKLLRVKYIGKLIRGNGILRTEVRESGMPCVRYGELYTSYKEKIQNVRSFVDEDVFELSNKMDEGDVAFTLSGENDVDIGRAVVNRTGNILAYGGDMIVLKNAEHNGDFLMYAFNSGYFNVQRTMAARGDIIVHLSADRLANMFLLVPPRNVQDEIAEYLNSMCFSIDNAVVSHRASIAKLEEYRKSIIYNAVTGKIDCRKEQ